MKKVIFTISLILCILLLGCTTTTPTYTKNGYVVDNPYDVHPECAIEYKPLKAKALVFQDDIRSSYYVLIGSKAEIELTFKDLVINDNYTLDDDYFNNHSLIVYYFSHSHGGYKDSIVTVEVVDNIVHLVLESEINVTPGSEYTQAIVERIYLIEVNKNALPENVELEVNHITKKITIIGL